ncbi:hypothetical protein JIY74_35680, partial [Vibrio harveyi]|nr:hypothetical protein [Vibrio harveyi]
NKWSLNSSSQILLNIELKTEFIALNLFVNCSISRAKLSFSLSNSSILFFRSCSSFNFFSNSGFLKYKSSAN